MRERGKENPINSTRECEITNRVKSWDFKKKVNGTKEVNKKCKEIKTLPRNYSKMPKISKIQTDRQTDRETSREREKEREERERPR